MKKEFYVRWENEYSTIECGESMPEGLQFSGPFRSLSDAKKAVISFLETKIQDTKENLARIRALRPDDFEQVEKEIDLF